MSQPSDRMKAWIDSFADDVRVVQKVVDAEDAPRPARLLAAAGLSYLVTRMDLIPDWEESAGIIDDAMVLRVALALGVERGLSDVAGDSEHLVPRLANEADAVMDFLGAGLYARFKHHVEGLQTQEVRGRSPATIIDDPKARGQLYQEIGDEMSRLPPAPWSDPEAVGRQVKNALSSKLAK
jgi:uncharacterized membrane protein YkvA (DUF1232 family)